MQSESEAPDQPVSFSFAQARLEKVTARLFTLALAVAGIEVFINAFGQIVLLDTWFGSIGIVLSMASHLLAVLTPWFTDRFRWAFATHALMTLILVALWPLQVTQPENLPDGFQPWLWWVLGPAAVAAGLSFRPHLAALVIFAIPAIWLILHPTPDGGSSTWLRSFQDATYTFLFSATFTLVLLLLRDQAAKTDRAAKGLADTETAKAAKDAAERERLRVGALIHDRVLTALIVAAKASSPEQVSSAKKSAQLAIDALVANAGEDHLANAEDTTVFALFGALKARFEESDFSLSEEGASDLRVPSEIAQAFTEAVLQAATNSLQHAGGQVRRELILRGTRSGFKIVVKDNGRGFRPARVSKSRLGLRLSIIERVESVGGRVFIESAPGKGASIILSWEAQ